MKVEFIKDDIRTGHKKGAIHEVRPAMAKRWMDLGLVKEYKEETETKKKVEKKGVEKKVTKEHKGKSKKRD